MADGTLHGAGGCHPLPSQRMTVDRVDGSALGLALLLAAGAITGCMNARASDADAGTPYVVVPAAEVHPLRLVPLHTVVLRSDSTPFNRITNLDPWPGGFDVVDGTTARVLLFDTTGRLTQRFGGKGIEDGQFEDPFRVVRRGDTLLVLDLGRSAALALFDQAGTHLRDWKYDNERMPTDIVVADDGIRLAISSNIRDRTSQRIVASIGPDGAIRGRGCQVDPRITASERAGGMIGRLVFAHVAQRGAETYCSQLTTPLVQVLDPDGRAIRTVDLAPPFYRPPVDIKGTTNSKRALSFMSSFTAHLGLVPTGSGFVELYGWYDRTRSANVNAVFACDSAVGRLACGSVVLDRRVLHVSAPDTLYVEESTPDGSVARIGVYRIAREDD